MKCCSCGEEIRDTARFCGFCGAEQTAAPAETMPPAVESNIPELNPTADLIAPEAAVIEEPPVEIPALEVENAAQLESEVVAELQSVEAPVEEPVILPVEEIPAPVDEPAEKPKEVPAPAGEPEEAPAPVPAPQPAPAPVAAPVSAPQPTPAPVAAHAPQPVAQSVYQAPPQPQYQASQPMYQPQYQAPQPVYQAPLQPQYQAPQPVYQPQYQAPQPVYQAPPQPQYQAPQPVYQPQYQAPQPQYQAPPQPQYQTSRPAYQTPNQVLYPTKSMKKRPAYQLTTGRGLVLLWLLSIITLGIYPLVMWSRMSVEINMVASRYDGKRTTHFMWMPVLLVLTGGIYFYVWIHKLCNRVGDELRRRNIQYKFSAATFWLWTFVYGMVGAIVTVAVGYFMFYVVAGDMIVAYIVTGVLAIASCVGPAIFDHKLLKAFNMMNADYNEKG